MQSGQEGGARVKERRSYHRRNAGDGGEEGGGAGRGYALLVATHIKQEEAGRCSVYVSREGVEPN